MGQAAAFLNGMVKGVDTVNRWKKDNADSERQAKQDADADASRAKQAAFEKEMASIDPMQGVKDRNQAAMNDWNAQNSAAKAVQQSAPDLTSPSIGATGIPALQQPSASFQKPDIYSAPPPNSPVTKAVSAGLPMQQPNLPPKPAMEQPTIGDALNYKAQVLDAKRRAGLDVSNDVVELTGLRKKMEDEGLTHSMALFNAGHFDDGIKAFNSVGNHTGWKLDPDSPPVDGKVMINGQPYPTKIVTMINKDGEKRTINTANDMYATMNVDNIIKFGQKGQELETDNKYKMGMLDVARKNADNKLAEAKAKSEKAPNVLASKKAGVGALDIAYGIKRDAMGEILNPSVLSETQKSQYFKDAAAISAMVEQGSDPWAAAEQVTGKTLRRQEEAKVAMPQGSSAAPSGSQASYPTPWK